MVLLILVMIVHKYRCCDTIVMVITDNSGTNNTSNDSICAARQHAMF